MMYIQLICLVCIQEVGNELNRNEYKSSMNYYMYLFKSTMITLYVAQTSIQTYSSRAHLVFMCFLYLKECHGMRYEAKFSLKIFLECVINFISSMPLPLSLVCH